MDTLSPTSRDARSAAATALSRFGAPIEAPAPELEPAFLLRFQDGVTTPQRLALDPHKKVIRLGRHPECELLLEDPSTSTVHARIIPAGRQWYIEDGATDKPSKHGTFVEGVDIRAATASTPLQDGARINVGPYTFLFQLSGVESLDATVDLSTAPAGVVASAQIGSRSIASVLDLRRQLPLDQYTLERLQLMAELGKRLRGADTPEEVLKIGLEVALAVAPNADRALSFTCADDGSRLEANGSLLRGGQPNVDRSAFSQSLLAQIVTGRQAALVKDSTLRTQSMVANGTASAAGIPLFDRNLEPLGALIVDACDPARPLNEHDLVLLVTLGGLLEARFESARNAKAALERDRMRNELDTGRAILAELLPRTVPEIAGYSAHFLIRPAKELAGDFLNCFTLPDGRIVFSVGDVAGKGLAAALVVAKVAGPVEGALRDAASSARPLDLGETFLNLDRRLMGLPNQRYFTMAVGILDPKTDELTLACAAHQSPLLYRMTGELETPVAGDDIGSVIGMGYDLHVDQPCRQCTVKLNPGDSVLFCTDGFPDARDRDGKTFGDERVRAAMTAHFPSARHRVDHLFAVSGTFSEGAAQADDMTAFCIQKDV